VDGHDRMYRDPISMAIADKAERDAARLAAKIQFPVAVAWDDQPLDDLGMDFIVMRYDEVEPAE
jgi:hypothetical protein